MPPKPSPTEDAVGEWMVEVTAALKALEKSVDQQGAEVRRVTEAWGRVLAVEEARLTARGTKKDIAVAVAVAEVEATKSRWQAVKDIGVSFGNNPVFWQLVQAALIASGFGYIIYDKP